MPYLMQICFDNDRRFNRKNYLFEYKGIKFKLVQNNPRKWADSLLTILPHYSQDKLDAAFKSASEFLSALSWELKSRIMVGGVGGSSWKEEFPLSKAKPSAFTFPRIPFGGLKRGYNLRSIPNIKTDYQRTALTLYREANASNNNYLSFMFYWQVLETRNTDAVGYVDKTYKKKRNELMIQDHHLSSLPLNGKTLGLYLQKDCRHAIAHIRRKPGKRKLDLDKLDERTRISLSVNVVKAFAEHYINYSIGLDDSLYLVRKSKNTFPLFTEKKSIWEKGLSPAYK
jgi:hypothetical protein